MRTLFEHGFQAEFTNNKGGWTGVIGQEVTKIVNAMEHIYPDIDRVQ